MLVACLFYVPVSLLVGTSSSTSTDNPQGIGSFGTLLAVFQGATGSLQGTTALAVLILVALFTSGAALMSVATRLVFAMARDGALPWSAFLRRLHPRLDNPIGAAVAVYVAVAALELIPLWDLAALQAIVNPYVACLQVGRGEEGR